MDPNNILFHDHGIAWVGLCKNANSAIKTAFAKSLNKETGRIHEPRLFHYVPLRRIAASGLWRFAIVRNPYDRIESCWRDKCFDNYKPSFKKRRLEKGMAFRDFVEVVANTPDEQSFGFGQHWRSQTYDLMIHGHFVVDYMGRFEAIDEAWEEVRAHSMKELPDLTRVNATTEPIAIWTEEIRRMVRDRFSGDFELLGYDA